MGEELSSLGVHLGIGHGKDCRLRTRTQILVPRAFQETATNPVNFFEAAQAGHCDF